MYLIYSHNLDTKEIIPRAKYSSRKSARINLLKEAQQWLLQYKTSDGNWELITHKFEAKGKESKFFIKRNDKNEDVLSIYQNVEIKKEGYIWTSTEKDLKKIIIFSVMEIPEDRDTERIVESSSYIVPSSDKPEDPELKAAIDSKREMIKEITLVLQKRRESIKDE